MLSKNSIGVITTLLLIILLSESRLFKIITDTYLGRTLLIIILLFASYLNKIIGTVCVFIIIIMFSIMKFNYEGFGNNDPEVSEEKKNAQDKKDTNDKKDTTTETKNSTDNLDTTTTNNASKQINTPTPVSKDEPLKDVINENKEKEKLKPIEGFDLQSTENNIRKGKQSNSIPIDKHSTQSTEVSPFEENNFTNWFGFL
jgi:hypothetical protein